MKSIKGIFLLLLASMAGLSTADFTDIIRDMCFLSFEQLPHPDPTLCFQYVQCIFVDGVVLECPPGNIFVNSLPCVPGSWVTCEVDNPDIPILPTIDPIPTDPTDVPILPTIDPITTDPTIPTWPTEEPELPDDICEGINIGFLPDPRSCTRFILCIFEVPEVWHCFEPTPIFDPSRQQCVAGNPVTCEIGDQTTTTPIETPPTTIIPPESPSPPTELPTTIIPPESPSPPTEPATTVQPPGSPTPPTQAPPVPDPTPPPTTTTAPGTPPPGICNGNTFRFVADPNSCFRYFWCAGLPFPGECSWDRIFIESLQGCVRGNQDTCQRDNNIINITIFPTRPTP